MLSIDLLIKICILLLLLCLSGFFSGAETGLASLNKIKIKKMQQEEIHGAERLEIFLKKPNRVLSTILIGNNIVNISASALATSIATELFRAKGMAIAIGIMTFLVLLFGEITPKTYAVNNSEKVSLWVARPIEILSVVLYPVVRLLSYITNIIIKILGGDIKGPSPFVTEEEIMTLMDVGQEEGLIERQEREMIDSIFEFDDIRVEEVMVPRIDIVGIEANSSFMEVLDMIIKFGHSRIPVYEKTIDHIIGVVYAKDLLSFFKKEALEVSMREIMRSTYFVPETKKVNDLLTNLQAKKIHMAIVVDEYGGTAGLITIEDVIEEIVGDILDEYDIEEEHIKILDEGLIICDGRTDIEAINEVLIHTKIPEEEFETISGFIFDLIGRVPYQGEMISYKDLKIKILEMGEQRISKIKIEQLHHQDD